MTSDPAPVPESRLVEAQTEAATFYKRQLRSPGGVGPREYLERRGLWPAVEAFFRCDLCR